LLANTEILSKPKEFINVYLTEISLKLKLTSPTHHTPHTQTQNIPKLIVKEYTNYTKIPHKISLSDKRTSDRIQVTKLRYYTQFLDD